MAGNSQPPPGGCGTSISASLLSSLMNTSPGSSSMTPAQAGGRVVPATISQSTEIIQESQNNHNILEISVSSNSDSDQLHFKYDQFSDFIFTTLKIDPNICLRLNFSQSTFGTKELMFKSHFNIDQVVGTYNYDKFTIVCKIQTGNVTKVTFKNVLLNIPDDKIINLCEAYGTPRWSHRPILLLTHMPRFYREAPGMSWWSWSKTPAWRTSTGWRDPCRGTWVPGSL